jgi:hypothetical protein
MKRASFGNSNEGDSDSDSDSGGSSSSNQKKCEPVIIGAIDRSSGGCHSAARAQGSILEASTVPVSDLLKGGGQLLQRLQALLPQLQQSNHELDARVAAGADVNIENVGEESARVIQMDLRFFAVPAQINEAQSCLFRLP